MSKYNLVNIYEGMSNDEFEDAKEANRLANHPKREIIKKIQAMIAKEKKASYATEDTDINNDGKVDKTDDELEYLNKINRSHFQTESLDLNEGGGTLKVEKQKDGKYYWTFTFKSGKVEEWPNGFATSAEAQKDFMYRSKYLKEARVDREVAERIEGLTNIELKRKFLFAFEDLYSNLTEEDPFYAEDVINHLSNEMHKHLKDYQDISGKVEEDTAMSGAIADEEEAGAIGTHLAEDKDKVAMKDVVIAILKDAKATNTEVQAYVDSLTNDIKLNGKEAYEDYEIDDYVEDFKNYIADKSLQEHFGRFMKDYQ
jgi:hypothetical protein